MHVNLFSPAFWFNAFVTTFITMIFIYLIKRALEKVKIPVASEIAASV